MDRGSVWECASATTIPFRISGRAYQEITDNIAADTRTRILFLAGVLAGLIGAVLVEIYLSIFEVVEGRREHTGARVNVDLYTE